MQEEITLEELVAFIIKNLFHFILSAILFALLGYMFVTTFVEPTYQSRAELLVNQGTQTSEAIEVSQIDTSIRLINTYRNIIISDSTLGLVATELGDDYSLAKLRESISVETPVDSQTFIVQAEMDTPEAAQEVLTAVVKAFEQQVQVAYEISEPKIFVLSPPSFNKAEVGPSETMYVLIGAMLGLVISGGALLLREVMDTRVRANTFAESLGLVTLGKISTMTKRNRNKMDKVNKLSLIHRIEKERIGVKNA